MSPARLRGNADRRQQRVRRRLEALGEPAAERGRRTRHATSRYVTVDCRIALEVDATGVRELERRC